MCSITIVIVNWHSNDLIKRLLDNLMNKAKNPEQLKVLIIDNTNGKDQAIRKIAEHKLKPVLKEIDPGKLKSSSGHAFALNQAMEYIDTEYCLVADPDIHVFIKQWDTFCISKLDHDNCIAIGAPYPFWKTGKYHDFPSPPFCFFRTHKIRQLKNNWTPFSDSGIVNLVIFLVRQIGRLAGLINRKRIVNSPSWRKINSMMENIFGVFSRDTGWRIAREANQKGLPSILFDTVFEPEKQLKNYISSEAIESLANEYELYSYDGQIAVTHKYGTGVKSWKTKHGGSTNHWLECIEKIENSYQ
ncbi:MAG: glycosyltransferase family 2 protein [Sedimentisphaerales bacterium]|nr:glycosyltransferase family 2 protein [Sedimentisphaerales bacterium]